jgi:hypothetical protein
MNGRKNSLKMNGDDAVRLDSIQKNAGTVPKRNSITYLFVDFVMPPDAAIVTI